MNFLDRVSKDPLISNLPKILQWEPVAPWGRIDGQKDMTRLIVTFRNVANTHKNTRNK